MRNNNESKIFLVLLLIFYSGNLLSFITESQVMGGSIHLAPNGDEYIRPGVTCLHIQDYRTGAGNVGSEIEYVPIRESKVEITSGLSHEEIERSIGSSLAVNSVFGPQNSDIFRSSLDFIRRTKEVNTAITFNYKIIYLGGNLVLVKHIFTPEAINLLIKTPKHFKDYCGDRFVNQYILGAEAYISVRFDFESASKKHEISPQLGNLTIDDLLKLSESLKIVREEDKKNIKVSISGWQKGGNAAEIVGIFNGSIAECNLSNLSNCQGILSNIVNYIKNDFGEPLKRYAFSFNSGRVVSLPEIAYILNFTGLEYCSYMQFPINPNGGNTKNLACVNDLNSPDYARVLNELGFTKERIEKEIKEIGLIPNEIGVTIHPSYNKLLKEYQVEMEYNLNLLMKAESECRINKRTCHFSKKKVDKSLVPFRPELLEILRREEKIEICFELGPKADISEVTIRLSEKGKFLGDLKLNELPRRDSNDCFLYHAPGIGNFLFDELKLRIASKATEGDKCRRREDTPFLSWIDWDLKSITVTHLRTNHKASFKGKRIRKGSSCKSKEEAYEYLPWTNLSPE